MGLSSSPRPGRALALVFVVILVVVGALFGYTYVTNTDTISSRNTRISGLEAYSSTANATIAANDAKIVADDSQITKLQDNVTSLQAQVSQDQSTITSLNNQVSQDQSTITSLNSQISSLQSQVSLLQTASLAGSFNSTTSICGVGIDCYYTINGAYANYGTNAANSASVTFTFYSGKGLTGQTLCITTVVLGQISGRSVNLLPTTTCASSSTTAAASFTWSFSY